MLVRDMLPALARTSPQAGRSTVTCWYCGSLADWHKCFVKSKREGTWKCPCCNAKIGRLRRQFGSWPPTDVPLDADKLSESARHQIFAGLSKLEGRGEIKAYALRFLENYRTEEQRTLEGGEFLPLGVWEKRGFDIESIKKHTTPENIRTDRVLGQANGVVHAYRHQR